MAAEFEAMSRIPFRPLSYENIDLAFDKELIVDYEVGNLYLKDAHGRIINLSESITNIIVEGGKLTEYLTVTIPGGSGSSGSGESVKITDKIIELNEKINEQQKVIDAITGGSSSGGSSGTSGPTIIIKPVQIVQDTNHQFINSTQFTEISNKVSIKEVTMTIPASGWSGSGPYTQTIACVGATSSMARPIIDINHTDSESFANAQKADQEWGKIYRGKTASNTITFYATEKPTVDLSAVAQLKITGLTSNSEVK